MIPKFPEDFFSYDDSFNQDSEPVVPATLFDQHNGDINEKEIEDNSDILAKKLPEGNHEEDITKEKRSDQEKPQIQPEPIKIISGKPEDAILSVQQQEPINKDIPADPKLENAKVNTELTTAKPLSDSDADSKKDNPELTKNTDYVIIPVAAINTDQLNPNRANPSVPNQAVGYPLQATLLNVQPNQFGTVPQNYVTNNNRVNNNAGQPMYVVNVPNNVTPKGNNPANAVYYLNNPSNNNMGYQAVAGTPYNLVSLGYQQNNQPNNYIVPVNQPNNLVATNQPMHSVPLNNPNGYYVLPNNQQSYPNGYVYQPNNPNGYVIQPNNGNNLNYQQNNPGGYIQPNNNNNLNNQQNYPNGYYVQPNNLNYQNGYNNPNNMNYQQNNPNGYVNQPNNINNYPNNPSGYNNQPNNPNGYGNQPNSFNNYPNNPNNYNNQLNNQYGNVNQANNLSDQPNGNINGPNDQQNSYENQPNNYNYQPNNPNGYNAQPNDVNNQQNYPNGYNNQPNNVDSYKDKQNNSGNVSTSGNIPQVLKTSEISENSILVPLFAFKDVKGSADIKDGDAQKGVESKE